MNYTTFKTNFERELLFQIITNMKRGRKDARSSKSIAQSFHVILKKAENEEQLIEALSRLSRQHQEIRDAFMRTMNEYENATVKEKLAILRNQIDK